MDRRQQALACEPTAHQRTCAQNGIAYDAAQDKIYMTGKNWPNLFEVTVAK